ncbi:MAG: hypothetical protein M1834_006438 [Cirrosporium novae-zelandiae]|nr:MAG: hypothetical protein M1834_006438 [Cirrosporium novae-zelandiae]
MVAIRNDDGAPEFIPWSVPASDTYSPNNGSLRSDIERRMADRRYIDRDIERRPIDLERRPIIRTPPPSGLREYGRMPPKIGRRDYPMPTPFDKYLKEEPSTKQKTANWVLLGMWATMCFCLLIYWVTRLTVTISNHSEYDKELFRFAMPAVFCTGIMMVHITVTKKRMKNTERYLTIMYLIVIFIMTFMMAWPVANIYLMIVFDSK